jgi:hypothetical protein
MIEQARRDAQAELLLADTADPKPVRVNDRDAGTSWPTEMDRTRQLPDSLT